MAAARVGLEEALADLVEARDARLALEAQWQVQQEEARTSAATAAARLEEVNAELDDIRGQWMQQHAEVLNAGIDLEEARARLAELEGKPGET
jgi:DNA repair exonuclease SbcCD ATPase subunit